MINAALPGINITKSKIDENIANLRLIDIWRMKEKGIENGLCAIIFLIPP
jgi:hypothetical protein